MVPIIEKREGYQGANTNYVVGVQPWDKTVVIDGVGVERLILAKEGEKSMWDTSTFSIFKGENIHDVEALRILHRIFSEWKLERSWKRTKEQSM